MFRQQNERWVSAGGILSNDVNNHMSKIGASHCLHVVIRVDQIIVFQNELCSCTSGCRPIHHWFQSDDGKLFQFCVNGQLTVRPVLGGQPSGGKPIPCLPIAPIKVSKQGGVVIEERNYENVTKHGQVEELDSLLPAPEYPSLTVVPKPGLCVKTKNDKGIKFFINICKLSEVLCFFKDLD